MQDSITTINPHSYIDASLMDELIGNCTIPDRNWEGIIKAYNSEASNKFLIPPLICSLIVKRIKEGGIPKMIFREYGISYTVFNNQLKKLREQIEEILSRPNISDLDLDFVNNSDSNPIFLLGRDIDRAVAYNFNTSLSHLKGISEINPQAWKDYMKLVNPEEFVEKETAQNTEVVIKISPGLMEGI